MRKKFLLLAISVFLALIFSDNKVFLSEETTSSADILEKVKEKVRETKANPKALLGVITDKTESSLQIKNEQGEIRLISINSKTTNYANLEKKNTNITYSDLAIGDFIIALGFVDENKILDAKRILITKPQQKIAREVFAGRVVSIIKKKITIELKDKTLKTATFPIRWKGPEINEVAKADKIIIVTVPDDKNNTIIRTVKIIEEKSEPTSTPPILNE